MNTGDAPHEGARDTADSPAVLPVTVDDSIDSGENNGVDMQYVMELSSERDVSGEDDGVASDLDENDAEYESEPDDGDDSDFVAQEERILLSTDLKTLIGYFHSIKDMACSSVLELAQGQPESTMLTVVHHFTRVSRMICVQLIRQHNLNVELLWIVTRYVTAITQFNHIQALPELADFVTALVRFPLTPQNLVEEYYTSIKQQQTYFLELNGGTREELEANPPNAPPKLLHDDRVGFGSGAACLNPPIPRDEVVRICDALPLTMAFLIRDRVVRLALANPLSPPVNVIGGYICDTCTRRDVFVSYQAILGGSDDASAVRNTMRVVYEEESGVGFDLCIACAVYFLREAEERMRLALHRPFVPFAAGALAGLQSQVVAHHGDWVEVVVRVSPWDVRPVVWVLDAEGATPPADWRARVTVRRMADDGGSVAEEDVCPICLDPLANEAPVRRTRCGHWFHADCIQEVIRSVDSACPMCRTMNVLETPELAEVLERNVYAVRVELTMAERQREEVLVGIGAILTADWQYHNVTNLCACEVVAVRRAAKGPPAAVPPPLPPGRKAT